MLIKPAAKSVGELDQNSVRILYVGGPASGPVESLAEFKRKPKSLNTAHGLVDIIDDKTDMFGVVGLVPAIVAAALFGASLGFAPFNRPVAKLFLGDVGSLPIGLLLAWLLLQLADHGHLAAAIILPLYYLADATITLGRRVAKGEPFWQAHRTHFYQRATDNGFSVPEILTRVFLVNLGLGVFALFTIAAHSRTASLAALAASASLVAWLLIAFAQPRR